MKISKEECATITNIMQSVEMIQKGIGQIEEKKTELFQRLGALRDAEKEWEQKVSMKYHLPMGIGWQVDVNTQEIIFPKETKAATPKEHCCSEESGCCKPEMKDANGCQGELITEQTEETCQG